MPGIKLAGTKINRLSLALLALLSSFPAAAEESPSSPWSLEWRDGFAVAPDAGKDAAEAGRNAAESETAAEPGNAGQNKPATTDRAGSATAAETKNAAHSQTAAAASQNQAGDTAASDPKNPAQGKTAATGSQDHAGRATAAEPSDDVWQRIRNGFQIDEAASQNPLVGLHESWFAARPESVLRLIERSRPYLYHIVEELNRRAMPMEIALLPMIESAYNSAALSPAAASGIWQFMPATGRHYGLRQDNWYDGRGDFTAATRAALDYLAKLYLDFGDWQLALAAYNCGEGCVTRAIRKNALEGLPTDYASLDLPNETRHYVPRLLAIKKLIDSPEQYGLAIEALPNKPYFNQVTVRASMDIHSAARLANMSSDEFIALNAAFPRKLIHSDTPVSLLLPVDKVDTFQRNLEAGSWETWKPYTVQKGEHPRTIAQRLGVSIARLMEHNQFHLKRGKFVRAQTILVPVKGRGVAAAEKPASPPTRHVVQRGDTLFSVALRYGLSMTQLTKANPKLGAGLKAGQIIRLPLNESAARETAAIQPARYTGNIGKSAQPARYTVKRGDNLNTIAQRFDISLADLKAWNPGVKKANDIRAGQTIVVKKP